MPPNADDPITPQQCCAARAYLGWTQQQLAEAAGVKALTVRRFERLADPAFRAARKYRTGHTVKMALAVAFERAGVTFEPTAITHPLADL